MAALYAQGLAWGDMHRAVRRYAARMSSVHHLLRVTPPPPSPRPARPSCQRAARASPAPRGPRHPWASAGMLRRRLSQAAWEIRRARPGKELLRSLHANYFFKHPWGSAASGLCEWITPLNTVRT